MLSVEAALAQVLEHAAPLGPVVLPLDARLVGRALAEPVASDIDSPPHDKSLVDGYAVIAADLAHIPCELAVVEQVVAGEVPTRAISSGQSTRVMTGAPLPPGADAVVMVEQTEALGDAEGPAAVRIHRGQVKPRQNVLRRGAAMRQGERVLTAGIVLRAIEIGLLAEMGRAAVRVFEVPRVAILSTGNELVPAGEVPGPGQIRNSNGPMLAACVAETGAVAWELGIARDDRDALREQVARGLEADVLVLSGGVSAGVLDLVPEVLAELGVAQVFHKVDLKPGKPLWFGVWQAALGEKLVFGLPGNPVSSLVCFELFVRPALKRLMGHAEVLRPRWAARLLCDYVHRGDRPTYHPAVALHDGGGLAVEPLAWQGSADLRTLAKANALACFPLPGRTYPAGELVEVLLIGRSGDAAGECSGGL